MSTPSTTEQTNGCDDLTVMFDGSCPLCRSEVSLYQSLSPLKAVNWVDVSEAHAGMNSEEQALYMARFHVREKDGRLLSGAAAFVALWLTLPGWRWLGRLACVPGMTWLLEWMYRSFLPLRPHLQRWFRAAEATHLAEDMLADVRSDHAGETGAVAVYQGMLWATRDAQVQELAGRHILLEQKHLESMSALLPPLRRSVLLPVWTAAGFLIGTLAALRGPKAVFATVSAIEMFVDEHYQQQINKLVCRPEDAQLRQLLIDCQQDEREHLAEATRLQLAPPGLMLGLWCKGISAGSRVGVWFSKRI